jgi:hypothetical protein
MAAAVASSTDLPAHAMSLVFGVEEEHYGVAT